ncbi:MAG: CoA transferase [Actinomycetia bacterium]|nr:CoA transferase [Actinomycetes bacterium]
MTTSPTSSDRIRQPLAGLVVIELATGIAGPYAGKLLADYGADVVKVEPPDGDWSRREGARSGERPELETSPLFLHLNTNKRSVVADVTEPDGIAFIHSLIERADVVIESDSADGGGVVGGWPGASGPSGGGAGLGVDELRAMHPGLVVTSVSPFGLSGPYAGLAGSEIVAYAMGGPMQATGDPDREPIKMAGNVVQYHCGSVAALATLAAVSMGEVSGEGTHIEVSNFETQAASIDRRATLMAGYEFDGIVGYRSGGAAVGPIPVGIYPTLDGYCQVVFAPNWMPRVAEMLGDEELIRRIASPDWYNDEEVPDLVNTALFVWTLQRTKQETMEDAQARQLAITPVNSTTDVLADLHFREREFWQHWDHPVVGSYEGPGPQFRMDGGWQPRRRAPLLGEHTDQVRAELAGDSDEPVVAAGASGEASLSSGGGQSGRASRSSARRSGGEGLPSSDGRRLPLEGVRVLDLTVVWAGPLCTMLLGDLGAEVIRLDNPNLFPTATRGAIPRPTANQELDLGQFWGRFPGGKAGERPWNRVAAFVSHSRNKLGATLDLRTELGRETFLELVDQADLLVENNSIRVLPSLDLDWDVLHRRNPRLISLRMPSLGLTGPYSGYVGFGAHMEALCGYSSLRGYRDLDPTALDTTYYMDPASGVTGAFAVLCALRRRDETGQGEQIEFAQAENLLNYAGEFFVDASLTGEGHECHGNRHPHRAPQGAYRCLDGDGGAETWMVLSVDSDDEWGRLVEAIGSPGWAADARLAGESARRLHHDEIDEGLAAWAAGCTLDEAVAVCRRAGVAAGPVLDEAGLLGDAHLGDRDWFRTNGSGDVPAIRFPGHQWRWDGPDLRWDELNMMGRDNDQVYRTLLGKSEAEMAALAAEGHLADGYRDGNGQPL